jgi:hypothetical protein
VESACLADALSREGGDNAFMDLWHIKTETYLQDGGSLDRYPNFEPKPEQIDLTALYMTQMVYN